MTDMHTGWTYTRSVRNNAHLHLRDALDRFIQETPFEVTGVDFDNGSEFINYDVIGWAAELDIYFTRSRPYKKNDQATVESKNNQIVRRYGFYWRYDTPAQLQLLNELWPLVNGLCWVEVSNWCSSSGYAACDCSLCMPHILT